MQSNLFSVRSAWENFMSNAPVGSAIRPVVLASWRRSREQEAPVQLARTEVLDQITTRRLSEQNGELLRSAETVLAEAGKWLSGTRAMLLLTDMQGTILRVAGDGRAMSQGRQIGLQQGGRWRERDIGTNAIGTALAMNAPVRIHAFEHFCQPVHPWSCAAAPVRDSWSGKPLGVVDISCAASHANEQSLAYATMLAQRIHADLCRRRQDQHQRILQHLLEELPRWPGHDMIAFDRRGHLIHCSRDALLRDTPLATWLDARGNLALLAETPPLQWMATLQEVWPEARCDVVRSENERIGAWLAIPRCVSAGGERGAQTDERLQLPTGESAMETASGAEKQIARSSAASPATVGTERAPPVGGAAENARVAAGDVAGGQGDVLIRDNAGSALLLRAFSTIIGESRVLREALALTMQMARHDLPVLLEGETGTGKEMFAQAIHAGSGRKGSFVPINCGALPAELIGSELFGYERGSFTGASPAGQAGKFEAADKGTLCLDEIGELPLQLQPYLLRVLEDQQVYRLGSHRSRPVNVRLIAMTNRQLEDEIKVGRFRQDLFFRIAVTRVFIPPLRERPEDIPLLVKHFAQLAAQKHRRVVPAFTQGAVDRLVGFSWPGNIRQLRNTIERLVALGDGGCIDIGDLPPELHGVASSPCSWQPEDSGVSRRGVWQQNVSVQEPAGGGAAPGRLKDMEHEAIRRMITLCRGNHSEAARRLGIARSTLYSRLQKTGNRL